MILSSPQDAVARSPPEPANAAWSPGLLCPSDATAMFHPILGSARPEGPITGIRYRSCQLAAFFGPLTKIFGVAHPQRGQTPSPRVAKAPSPRGGRSRGRRQPRLRPGRSCTVARGFWGGAAAGLGAKAKGRRSTTGRRRRSGERLQIIRDWVLRFNAWGPAGLLDGKSLGLGITRGESPPTGDTKRATCAVATSTDSGGEGV